MKIHSQRRKSILENKLLTRIPNSSSSSLLRTCFHSSPELFLAVSGQNSPQCKLVQPAFHYSLVHLLTLILEQIKVFIGAASQWPLTVVVVLLHLPFYQNVHHWKKKTTTNVNSDLLSQWILLVTLQYGISTCCRCGSGVHGMSLCAHGTRKREEEGVIPDSLPALPFCSMSHFDLRSKTDLLTA